MTTPEAGPVGLLGGLGRSWGWVLAFGIVTLVAGCLVLAWPGETLLVLAVVLGIELIVFGIFQFVAALGVGDEVSGGTRVLLALLGVLSIIIGLWAVRHALVTLVALAVFLGIFWVVSGTVQLFTAFSRSTPDRGWSAFMGILSILAGIIVLAWPGLTLLTLSVILGVWLVVLGILQIVASFRLRKLGQAVDRVADTEAASATDWAARPEAAAPHTPRQAAAPDVDQPTAGRPTWEQ